MSVAKVDQRRNQATITYEPSKIQPETIARIITEKTGFKAEIVLQR